MKTKVTYAKPLAKVVEICATDLAIFARSRTLDELTALFMECLAGCVIEGEDTAEMVKEALARFYP